MSRSRRRHWHPKKPVNQAKTSSKQQVTAAASPNVPKKKNSKNDTSQWVNVIPSTVIWLSNTLNTGIFILFNFLQMFSHNKTENEGDIKNGGFWFSLVC